MLNTDTAETRLLSSVRALYDWTASAAQRDHNPDVRALAADVAGACRGMILKHAEDFLKALEVEP